ncbi:MAG: hypothetical protein AAF518_06250 [Spirochaetota bacterium]
MQNLNTIIEMWVIRDYDNLSSEESQMDRKKFIQFLQQLNYPHYKQYEPQNDINFYAYRFHFGKSIQTTQISKKLLQSYYNAKIPLVFPHILISTWSLWYTILWEVYEWKGSKYSYSPRFTWISKQSAEEQNFAKEIFAYAETNHMQYFTHEQDRIIPNSGPLKPWIDTDDLTISDILFQGAPTLYNVV